MVEVRIGQEIFIQQADLSLQRSHRPVASEAFEFVECLLQDILNSDQQFKMAIGEIADERLGRGAGLCGR